MLLTFPLLTHSLKRKYKLRFFHMKNCMVIGGLEYFPQTWPEKQQILFKMVGIVWRQFLPGNEL